MTKRHKASAAPAHPPAPPPATPPEPATAPVTEARAPDAGEEPQPAVTGDPTPQDPPPPAQAEPEAERELVEAFAQEPAGAPALNVTVAAAALTGDHIAALGDMAASRYGLYAFPPHGFAVQEGPAHHSPQVVKDLIDEGLAFLEPSGGRCGSVKVSAAGQEAYKLARQQPAAAE